VGDEALPLGVRPEVLTDLARGGRLLRGGPGDLDRTDQHRVGGR
jgi:hypothetical protein